MTTEKRPISKDEESKMDSRRGFFKKLALGGAALTTAGATVKFADSVMPSVDRQAAYQKDVDPGDEILAQREHVLMSKEEKESMVQMFIDDYEKNKTEA